MLTLLSPAKKLNEAPRKGINSSTPIFLDDSEKLIKNLRKYSPKKLSKLMGLSPALSELNVLRYDKWDVDHDPTVTKEAVFMFDGEVYSGLNSESFSPKEMDYTQDHLRILSGLYGLLRPKDGIHPYRLEMGTKLKIGRKNNLYEFWGDKIVDEVNEVLSQQKEKVLVNLASNEYFKSVNKKKLNGVTIIPSFKDFNNGAYKSVMVYAKKARGMMAAFIMKNRIENIADLKAFDTEGYYFNSRASTDNEFVFYRG